MSEETQDNKVLPGWFVPADQKDKPEAEQVRYKIRGLAGTELLDVTFVRDELSDSTTMTSRGGNACIKRGLLGWENLTAPDGSAVAFDERRCSTRCSGASRPISTAKPTNVPSHPTTEKRLA